MALAVIVVVLGVVGWIRRDSVLPAAADLWVEADTPGPADIVAVFGGGLDTRPFAAAEYYKQGLVKKVLVSNDRVGAATELGVVKSAADLSRDALIKLGVPEGDIETFGNGLADTREEVLALRDWAVVTDVRRIIVPTEIFSTRRVRWMLRRGFGDKFAIQVPALVPRGYRRDNWWQSLEGIVSFQNEVLKYAYYRLKY